MHPRRCAPYRPSTGAALAAIAWFLCAPHAAAQAAFQDGDAALKPLPPIDRNIEPAPEALSASLVVLAYEIRFDASRTRQAELWRRVEAALGAQILDAWLPIDHACGFFVDRAGTLATTKRIARLGNPAMRRHNGAGWYKDRLRTFLEGRFAPGEIDSLCADIDAAFDHGDLRLAAYRNGAYLGVPKVRALAAQNEIELAIVQVPGVADSRPLDFLPAADIVGALVGKEVRWLGVDRSPGDTRFIPERKPVVARGNISALRVDGKTDIQTSAFLDYDSFGGPLLDSADRVVAINVGSFRGVGNQLTFAVSMRLAAPFMAAAVPTGSTPAAAPGTRSAPGAAPR